MAGNVLRGALGSIFREIVCAEGCPGRAGKHILECERRESCSYAQIFEPAATGAGPSGLSDWPRPFVIRCAALNGSIVQPGEQICFQLNLFDLHNPALDQFTRAVAQWADLISVEHSEIVVDLSLQSRPASHIRVEFQTPTELKRQAGVAIAEFPLLLARARDRVSTLRSLYGTGPLEIDFRGLGERARSVKTLRSELRQVAVQRRSSRTGQRHDIGGVVGFAEYEGDLTEFVPYLEAAAWTGVGRHCAWGNGQIQTKILTSEF